MKKILLVCGSGIATSTVVRIKVEDILNSKGKKGQFTITQGSAAQVPNTAKNYDLCISTTYLEDKDCDCPLIIGTAFLMGRGTEPVVDKIMEVLFGE